MTAIVLCLPSKILDHPVRIVQHVVIGVTNHAHTKRLKIHVPLSISPSFEHERTPPRTRMNRQQPFGSPEWQERLATMLGLASTLRPRGRPGKKK